MGMELWLTGIFLVAALIMLWLVMDGILWLMGEPTISQWLRKHPRWFWFPAVIMMAFIALLAIHLFVF